MILNDDASGHRNIKLCCDDVGNVCIINHVGIINIYDGNDFVKCAYECLPILFKNVNSKYKVGNLIY